MYRTNDFLVMILSIVVTILVLSSIVVGVIVLATMDTIKTKKRITPQLEITNINGKVDTVYIYKKEK